MPPDAMDTLNHKLSDSDDMEHMQMPEQRRATKLPQIGDSLRTGSRLSQKSNERPSIQ